jgi:hypothetical protein
MSWKPMTAAPRMDIATHVLLVASVLAGALALTCLLAL